MTPIPVISLTLRPAGHFRARLAASGGWLWYTDGGALHGGWTAQVTLTAGAGL